MEPEGSLPHSQVPANCPYHEPHRSSPYPPQPTSWRPILILCFNLRLGLPSGLFPSDFPTKHLYTPLLSPIHATKVYIYLKSNMWDFKQIMKNLFFFTVVPCILILSKCFIYQLMHKRNAFKRILKFILKQLLHVSVQSPSSESALFELAKVTVVQIIN